MFERRNAERTGADGRLRPVCTAGRTLPCRSAKSDHRACARPVCRRRHRKPQGPFRYGDLSLPIVSVQCRQCGGFVAVSSRLDTPATVAWQAPLKRGQICTPAWLDAMGSKASRPKGQPFHPRPRNLPHNPRIALTGNLVRTGDQGRATAPGGRATVARFGNFHPKARALAEASA